jgi:hypothetical protein
MLPLFCTINAVVLKVIIIVDPLLQAE